MTTDREEAGVLLKAEDGSRSSQRVGRTVFSEAVAAVDGELASSIARTRDWRKSYLEPVCAVVAAGARSSKHALRIAGDGVESLHRHLVFARNDDERSLLSALERSEGDDLHTTALSGEGAPRRELEVPYLGEVLAGDRLRRQIESWQVRGIIEPSSAAALERVLANPEWLDLSGRRFVLLGAASQMGPLQHLLGWGAEVIAIDLPQAPLWEHIFDVARSGTGKLVFPTRPGQETPGVDLLADLPVVARWLAQMDGPMTIGNYVYADGSTFVRLAGAADALIAFLMKGRTNTSLAYLATPTDAFAVTEEIVDRARSRRRRDPLPAVLRAISVGRLYQPNYRARITDDMGRGWSISDCLVPIQGPNYALAKALQRWRALVARDDGHLVSANVAPSTRTSSVIKNRMLAAAYRGAARYGVEVFEPETSRALMSALLVHDLRNPNATARPETELAHPFDLFVDGAAHGGIWSLAYEPRSVLPLALARGWLKRSI